MAWLRAVLNWLENDAQAFADASQHSLLLQQQGDLAKAEEVYQQVCLTNSDGAIAQLYFAVMALLRQHWQEARESFELLIRSGGDTAEVFTMLGASWLQLGDPTKALHAHQSALELKPQLAEAHRGRADALRALGDLEQAISGYQAALQVNQDYVQARWNLATTLLLVGEYQRGWYHYRVRFSPLVGVRPLIEPAIPMTEGPIAGTGETILLIAEQGLGDTIQFVRYALHLREMGIPVALVAQPELHGVLAGTGISLFSGASNFADVDARASWLPLMSLPALLDVSPQAPLVTAPYLRPSSSLPEGLQSAIAAEGKPLVALNWQGNPSVEISNFSGRSLPLEAFVPLAAIHGVEFLSLQKGYGSEQLEFCSFRQRFSTCQQLVDQLWDFKDIAAVISRCDLLITSDTAVAHVAGAIGHPVWLLLKTLPDWRWGLEGETTFWYPSMRLFRQRESGNWDEVMQRVATALQEFVAVRSV